MLVKRAQLIPSQLIRVAYPAGLLRWVKESKKSHVGNLLAVLEPDRLISKHHDRETRRPHFRWRETGKPKRALSKCRMLDSTSLGRRAQMIWEFTDDGERPAMVA
jgi:hypothetical protein